MIRRLLFGYVVPIILQAYILAKDKLTAFLDKVPKQTLVVIDDAYHDYVVADDFYNSIEFANKYSNLIVLRTFSKIYGIACFKSWLWCGK